MIDYVFYLIGFILCMINIIWIFGVLTENKIKISIFTFLSIIIIGFLSCITIYLKINIIKMIISIIAIVLLNKKIYKCTWEKTIFYSIFIWIVGMFIDFIFMSIFTLINTKFNVLNNVTNYIATFALQIFYNFVARCKWFKIVSKCLYKVFQKVNIYIIFFIVTLLIYLGANAVSSLGHIDRFSIIFVLSIFAITIIFQKLKIIYNGIIGTETNRLLLDNNNFYVDLNYKNREFRHNLNHKLNVIKSYGNQKVISLINELIIENNNNVPMYNDLDKLPIGINGMIQQKIIEYKNDNLNVLVDNNMNEDIFDLIKARTFNKFCEVVGVCIDNALEASVQSIKKILYVSIEETEEEIIFIIKNSFSNCVNLEEIGNRNYSTKGKNHGIGLFSILLKKEVKTSVKVINDLFETEIKVYKLKN